MIFQGEYNNNLGFIPCAASKQRCTSYNIYVMLRGFQSDASHTVDTKPLAG